MNTSVRVGILGLIFCTWFCSMVLQPIVYADVAMPTKMLTSPNYMTYERLAVNSSSATIMTDTSPAKLDHIMHVLKDMPSSTIRTIELGAYSDEPLSNQIIEISRSSTATTCHTYVNGSTNGNNDAFIRVKIEYGSSTVIYKIHNSKVCTAGSITNPNDTTRSVKDNGNQFYATYKIPAATATQDPYTQLYRAKVTIGYDQAPASPGSNKQDVRFQVKLHDPCGPSCRSYLTPMALGTDGVKSTRNYSTLYDNVKSGKFWSLQRYQFGVPCTAAAGTVQDLTVSIYDLDNHQSGNWDVVPLGNGGAYIEKFDGLNWVRIADSEYKKITHVYERNGKTVEGTVENGTFQWGQAVLQPKDSSVSTNITISAEVGTRYRVAVTPILATNLVGVGLPTDTIYGFVACSAAHSGDQPYFEVNGGDIMAGIVLNGVRDTSADIISWNGDNNAGYGYAGANTQLAAIASGKVQSFVTNAKSASPPWRLAFANTGDTRGLTTYGGTYEPLPSAPDYIALAESKPGSHTLSSGVVVLDSLTTSGTYIFRGNITVHGKLPRGIAATLIAKGGSVYVDGSITYAPYDITTIPRLNMYAAKDIIISKDVGEIHGVFVASTGSFYSCGTGILAPVAYRNVGANYEACNNPLKVYGSVIAQKMVLSRTHGSWTRANDGAAETFIASPETWLAKPQSLTTDSTFDYYVSLPPIL